MHIEFQYGYYFFLTHLSLRQAVARKLCFESEAAVDVANRFARNTIADMTAYVELIQRCRRRRRQKGTLSLSCVLNTATVQSADHVDRIDVCVYSRRAYD